MTRGLSDKSDIKEEVVKSEDGKTATRYRVVEEKIDLGRLKKELEELKNMEKPSDEELLEEGKAMHPYFTYRKDRIALLEDKIESIENG